MPGGAPSGGCGSAPTGGAGGAGNVTQAHATPGQHAAVVGAVTLGQQGPVQAGNAFHAAGSSWKQVPGRSSESPEAVKAYGAVQAFIAKYPTEQSLKDAGFTSDQGGNHYNVGRAKVYDDGTTHLAHVIVENGKVTGAQFDSNARNQADAPPAWSGVQWHWHDHGKSGWMSHMDASKPIDLAFIEQKQP